MALSKLVQKLQPGVAICFLLLHLFRLPSPLPTVSVVLFACVCECVGGYIVER